MSTKYIKAKRKVLREILFHGSSAQRGVTFNGLELLGKMLKPVKAEKALNEIKHSLRNDLTRYKFWIAVYRDAGDNDVCIDTYIVERDSLTVPLIDTWLNGYIEGLIDEVPEMTCLGYAWVGSLDMSVMYEEEEPNLLKIFESQGIYDQDKRARIVQQYHAEQASKQEQMQALTAQYQGSA